MEMQLREFAFVILDATFFTARFPDELGKQLAGMNLYVPMTFYSEKTQYAALLTDEQRQIYDQNYAVLTTSTINTVKIDTVKHKPFQSDIWGTVNVLSQIAAGMRCLLITSNQLLLQRVVLEHVPVAIYYLPENEYIAVEDQTTWMAACEFQDATGEDLACPYEELPDELTLYQPDGDPVRLEQTDMDGAEAKIYTLPEDPTVIAKIFSGKKLEQKKIRNVKMLREIGRKMSVPWAMFPQKELFWDEACTVHAGFIQTYATKAEGLDQNALYCGDPFSPYCDLNTKISVTVNRCLQLVRQIALLNIYGLYLSDYNLANFAEDFENSGHILMWDVDSFCSRYYKPSSWDNDMQPDFLIHREEKSNAEAMVNCTEMMYIRVFRMLTLGYRAFEQKKRDFLLANTNSSNQWRKESVPSNIWDLFELVFKDQNRSAISVDALLHELTVASKMFQEHPEYDLSYQRIWEQCETKSKTETGQKPIGQSTRHHAAPGLRVLRGKLGKGDWDGLSLENNLKRVRTNYPLASQALDFDSHRTLVTPRHYQQCNIRPPIYKNTVEKKHHKKTMLIWTILLILSCVIGSLYIISECCEFEIVKGFLPAAKQVVAWAIAQIIDWFRGLVS